MPGFDLSPLDDEILYLSGPMTGLPDFNRPLMQDCTQFFRDAGVEVFSPHEITSGVQNPNMPWQYYMTRAVVMQMGTTAWAGLPGWTRSKGAKREFDLAVDLQHKLFLVHITPPSEGVMVNLGALYELEQIG